MPQELVHILFAPGRTVQRRRRTSPGCVVCVWTALTFITCASFASAHPGAHHDIERATEALAASPSDVDLLVRRAHLYRIEGQLPESLLDLDRARKIAPERSDVILQRGLTLSAMGKDAEAEIELGRVIHEAESARQAYTERGHIRARTDRPVEAIADYDEVLRRAPQIELYLVRGRLQESIGRLDDAAKGYRDGIARLRGAPLLKIELVRVEITRKQYDVALKLIDEELDRAPIKTDWLRRRAEALAVAGKNTEAQNEFGRALTEANRVLAKRKTAIHLLARAKIYHAMGRLEAAREDLESVLRESPALPAALELEKKLKQETLPVVQRSTGK